jgi:hypothetical protein
MYRRALALGLMIVAGCGAAACGSQSTPQGSKAFCAAADRYNTELEHQQKTGTIDLARQVSRVTRVVETAPKAIHAAAQRFLDALRAVETDPSVKNDPAVKRSVDAVNRYANQACGVYTSSDGP